MDYSGFEQKLGYKFKNINNLVLAFTHTTYVFEHNEGHFASNQRLEFIGDAVIDLVVGRKLYELRPFESEGYLSKTRSRIVCEKSFANEARKLNVGKYLLLGKGEALQGGADNDSILADAFEAIIAAVFLDSDYDTVAKIVLNLLDETINLAIEGKIFIDYKSKLLEISQTKNKQHKIEFKTVAETGPSHMRVFEVAIFADNIELSRATGKSKREAEQKCAQIAIDKYSELFLQL